MNKPTIGVLVMSYGTPESMEQVEAYYTHIRRGRPPEPEQLKELENRYAAIVGGVFPLRENTNQQVAALQSMLDEQYPDYNFRCYQGMKHAGPFIEDGVTAMAHDGIQVAVGVVLAPHYSAMSVGSYIKRAKDTANEQMIAMTFVQQYHLHPFVLQALTERIEAALNQFAVHREEVRVLFSAHSLPQHVVEGGDPYAEQMLETSRALAEATGHNNWQFVWQSAGQTAVPWLGPDILDVMRTIRTEEQVKHVLICPIGFVSDHLEVLYDIDIECKQLAEKLGMVLKRTKSLNSDPLYMKTLSDVIMTAYKEGSQ